MGVSAHPYKKKDKNQINTNKIMEQNMTTIPFDLELAKKINNGEYNGTIVTSGRNFRVEFVYYKEEGMYPILGVVHTDHGIIGSLLMDVALKITDLNLWFQNIRHLRMEMC